MISQLKFLPATNKNKPTATQITVNIRAFAASQKAVFFLWAKEHMYLLMKSPNQWVRVAFLINKKGKVLEAKAIDSSDKKFEKEAVKAIKNQKFNKNNSTYQLIKRIDFNLAGN